MTIFFLNLFSVMITAVVSLNAASSSGLNHRFTVGDENCSESAVRIGSQMS